MQEKKVYEEPVIEVIDLEKNDFITMSNETDLQFPGGWITP